MLYSKSSEYAIQAMIYIAEKQREENLSLISEIAKSRDIPRHFLAKLVQVLAKHRLIKSIRGRNGGIKLAKDATKITIENIVIAIDGPPPDDEMCVIGLEVCTSEAPCPLHDDWELIKNEIHETLAKKNLDELVDGLIEKRKYLTSLGIKF